MQPPAMSRLHDGTASVSITDDGIGFDLTELSMTGSPAPDSEGLPGFSSTRGLGLLGMHERIQLLGGEMEITSAPSSGTRIDIRVPIAARSPVYD
jgi:two-component system sensor histidine kinase DegS